jgi:2-polyprenyl-3-methyl-5-hydroxy-6-metoxy-1,4-benzoquinol methylase
MLPHNLDAAIAAMLAEFAGNQWMTEVHWPENEERIRLIIADVMSRYRPSGNIRILDVGCFNGYVSLVLAGLGYSLTATDVCQMDERRPMLDRYGIQFVSANLNSLDPFHEFEDASFDVVIMGEVIEHVLNHPVGLLRETARVLRNSGLLVMTTPNPATLMNAWRLLAGVWTLWGTQDFMRLPKISGNQIIAREDIHYREYQSAEVSALLNAGGFCIEKVGYMGMGVSKAQPLVKRLAKSSRVSRALMSLRLFGCTHYFLARKAA